MLHPLGSWRWRWACAAGEEGGRTLGLNLGGTWTRGTGVTENVLFVDGRVHKISDELDAEGVPRRIRSAPGAAALVDLAFSAERRRALGVNLLALSSRLRWGLGASSGTVSTPSWGRHEIRVARASEPMALLMSPG